MQHKRSESEEEGHPVPPNSPTTEFDDPGMSSGHMAVYVDNLKTDLDLFYLISFEFYLCYYGNNK